MWEVLTNSQFRSCRPVAVDIGGMGDHADVVIEHSTFEQNELAISIPLGSTLRVFASQFSFRVSRFGRCVFGLRWAFTRGCPAAPVKAPVCSVLRFLCIAR